MNRTFTFCAVMLLVVTLSAATAGAFACQIDCVTAPAPPISDAGSCGSHGHMPGHAPANDSGGQRHSGHSHDKIIAAAHGSSQRTTLQQFGIWPQVPALSALTQLNRARRSDFTTAKSPSLIFTTPVLRI